MNVALGAKDEDTLTSLANRIIRLNAQMTASEKKAFAEKAGIVASKLAETLLNVFDEDVLTAKAKEKFNTEQPTEAQIVEVQSCCCRAINPF